MMMMRQAGGYVDAWNTPPDPGWSIVGMVRYRSRRDFLDFALEIERGDIVMHKWAAIATTHVFPVQPLVSLVLVRSAVLVVLCLGGLAAWALLR